MTELSPIPDHVPASLVYDFDVFAAPELHHEPHRSAMRLHKDAPPVFFSPRNGGHWVIVGAVEALEMLRRHDIFSNTPEFCSTLRKPATLPNHADVPEHTEYRRIINPAFTPAAVNAMEAGIREMAIELIEDVLARGQTEFVAEIAKRFPVNIFLGMVGAPLSDRDYLLEYAELGVRHPTREGRNEASAELGRYVMRAFEERRRKPGNDLMSRVLAADFQGRKLNDDELLGMGLLLMLGGLDTVASMLSFIMLHLGRNQGQYRELIDDPSLLPAAVEELMRVHGVASMQRGVTHDNEFLGITFKKYDRLHMLPQLWGLDDRIVDRPAAVDFKRETSPHLAFGGGPHRCIGSHLARVEIRVFLEEWTKRIPAFSVAKDWDGRTSGGVVWTPLTLPLEWKTQAQ